MAKDYNHKDIEGKWPNSADASPGKQKEYDHKIIEKKWQDSWEKEGVYSTENPSNKPKQYILDMFPYPSGAGLHVGHPRGYIGSDVLSRMRRMQGYNVLHPMGFDAFGLPAEQYAIQTGEHPSVITEKAIETYKKQLEIIGLSYDWSREVQTIDPKYYKWTQWIFLKLYDSYYDEKENKAKPISELIQKFEKEDASWSAKSEKEKQDILMNYRLAYEGYSEVNWSPDLGTVLANDEVVQDENGNPVSERGGFPVEKKNMRQWFLRITAYADRLLSGLETIDWPEHIKEIQRNWIGKSEGAEIDFQFSETKEHSIKVFTTRPDTIFGATFVAVSAGHANGWLQNGWNPSNDIKEYISKTLKENEDKSFAEKEKTGIYADFEVINPATKENIPVWITNYVLDGVGTGAIMAVPAHDERDFEFAKRYNLAIKQVISQHRIDLENPPQEGKKTVERIMVHALVRNPKTDEIICLKWKQHPWTSFVIGGAEEGEDLVEAAKREVFEETGYKNLKFIKYLNKVPVISEYYAAHKGENRLGHSSAILFDLENEERDEISEEENKKHEVTWVSFKDLQSLKMTCSEKDIWLRGVADNFFHNEEGILSSSGEFSGMKSEEAKAKITEFVGGKMVTKYKMRDAIFARQRYWGEPIPLVHKDGIISPLSEKDLPLELPKVDSYKPSGTGESPLAGVLEWAEKGFETNTMPGWAGSSWYFLRYMDPKNDNAFASDEALKYWQDVDVYVGGSEHATGHLLYSRFWHKVLHDLGHVPTDEPFKLLKNQGLILASDGRKMSKRWGNVVNPDEMVDRFGADSFRLYEMFIGPFEQYTSWNTDGLVGTRRFLERVWRAKEIIGEDNKEIDILVNKTIKKITEDIENFRFNTSVSSMMILVNSMESVPSFSLQNYKDFLKILAPFAPHMTEELWHELGESESIHLAPWPKFDESKIKDEKIKIAVQVNGKVRAEIEISPDDTEEVVKNLALSNESVAEYTKDKEIKKFIYVKGKIVNIVV